MQQNVKQNDLKKAERILFREAKCHTIKVQIVINGLTGEIICGNEENGAIHDFELFKRSNIHMLDDILMIGDKGYQGIRSIHTLSLTPFKKPKMGS